VLSIALTIHSYAVALSSSPAGLNLCSSGRTPKPLNFYVKGMIMQFEVDLFQGHRPYVNQLINAPNAHVLF